LLDSLLQEKRGPSDRQTGEEGGKRQKSAGGGAAHCMQLESAAQLHRSVESARRGRRLQKLGRTARAFKSFNCSLASREKEERRRGCEGGWEAVVGLICRSQDGFKSRRSVCLESVPRSLKTETRGGALRSFYANQGWHLCADS